MTGKSAGVGKSRLLAVGALVLGLMVAPATAQADAVREGNCTAQLTATPGADTAEFTIRCSEGVQGLQFSTSEGAVIFPPAVQPSGGNPTHGFPCANSGGTPDRPQFRCKSGSPSPPGSPGLAPGETGTITLETMDPCGSDLAILDLIVDTGPEGDEDPNPLTPPEDEATFDREVRVQCEGTDTGGGDDTGGDDTGDNEATAAEQCPDGRQDVQSTEHTNEDRDRGEPEGEHLHSQDSDIDQDQFCRDFGAPEGGVDAGFGGTATNVKEASILGEGGPGALLLAGSGIVWLGLLTGGVALARRS